MKTSQDQAVSEGSSCGVYARDLNHKTSNIVMNTNRLLWL